MLFWDDKNLIRFLGVELTRRKLFSIGILILAIMIMLYGVVFSQELIVIVAYMLLLFALKIKVAKNEEVKVIAISAMYFYFVYSTYLGRNNWLGSNFYKVFMMTELPLGWVLLAITGGYLFSIYYIARPYITIKKIAVVAIFTFLFDLGVWYPLSFISYYSGVEGKIMSLSKLLLDTTEKTLNNHDSDVEKEYKLRNVYKNVSMQAKLYKNEKLWMETDSARFTIENPRNYNVVFDHEKTFDIGGNTYRYSASKAYRPDFLTGVIRAVTWSVFPDRFGDDEKLEKMSIPADSNEVYLGRRKAGRSMNWWLIYSATFGLFIAAMCYWKKRELNIAFKLEQTEKTLYQQYKNAGLYQELLFSQLSKEFNDVMASKAKSHLQEYVASLGKDQKQVVLNDNGFEETMDSIKTSIGDKVHTLKNQWAKSISDAENENTKADEIVKIILDDLRGLKTVFDVSYSKQALSVVENTVKNAVPKSYAKIPTLKFTDNYLRNLDEHLAIIVNLDRLKSIILNLLQNSKNATQRFKLSLPKEERKGYLAGISVTTEIEQRKGKTYYTICVQDNGGGFPNPDVIYKEPVISSDKSRGERMGAGTVYIDMFVKRMRGFIEASNEPFNDGRMGAKTKVFIPIAANDEEGKEV